METAGKMVKGAERDWMRARAQTAFDGQRLNRRAVCGKILGVLSSAVGS
jgi:hypothetical protein